MEKIPDQSEYRANKNPFRINGNYLACGVLSGVLVEIAIVCPLPAGRNATRGTEMAG